MTNQAQNSTSVDWQTIVTDWFSSGLTQKQYCEQHGFKSHQLGYYYRKFHSNDNSTTKLASVAIHPDGEKSTSSSGFVLAFPSGIKLSVPTRFCHQSLQRLLITLKEVAC